MDLGAAPAVPHPAEMGELVQLSQSRGWSSLCQTLSELGAPTQHTQILCPGMLGCVHRKWCFLGAVLQFIPFLYPKSLELGDAPFGDAWNTLGSCSSGSGSSGIDFWDWKGTAVSQREPQILSFLL